MTIKHGRIHINLLVATGREEPKQANFLITIGRQYPVSDVRLYLGANLTEVQINDLRDHLENAIGE